MSSFKRTTVFGLILFGFALAGAYWVQNHVNLSPVVVRHAGLENCFLKNFKRDVEGKPMTQAELARLCASTAANYRQRLMADGLAEYQAARSLDSVSFGIYRKTLKLKPPCPLKKIPKKKEIQRVS